MSPWRGIFVLALTLLAGQSFSADGAGEKISYERILRASENLQGRNIQFKPVSGATWATLSAEKQKQVLGAYSGVRTDQFRDYAEIGKTLNLMRSNADLDALRNLAQTHVIDPRIVDEFKSSMSLNSPPDHDTQISRWLQVNQFRLNKKAPVSPIWPDLGTPGLTGTPALAFGRGFDKCGDACAVVAPGSPRPGNPALPVIQPAGNGPLNLYDKTLAYWVAQGRRARVFNPLGFLEVVAIESGDPTFICTGTLIAPHLVLTAAHCIAGKPKEELRVRIPVMKESILAGCNEAILARQSYETCVGFTTSTVGDAKPHTDYVATTHLNDVGYIVLKTPQPEARIGMVRFVDTVPKWITMAGYGDNALEASRKFESRYALEVGWHSGDSVMRKDGNIEWLFSKASVGSATCSGDSGGPIYSGDYVGGAEREHVVFAITTLGTSSTCENFLVRQTRLATPTIRSWICDEPALKGAIADCKIVSSQAS